MVRPGNDGVCPGCLLRLGFEAGFENADGAVIESSTMPRLLAPIGRGPLGTVYLAHLAEHDPPYITVKLLEPALDPEIFARAMHDAAVRLKRNPLAGVAGFVSTGLSEDLRAFVVAEFIAGWSFRSYFQQDVTGRERLRVLVDLVRTVAALHEREVVHGSLTPGNVVVVPREGGSFPVLLDVAVRPALEAARLRSPGAVPVAPDFRDDMRSLLALIRPMLERVGRVGARDLRTPLLEHDRDFATAGDMMRTLASLTD
jgi:hypothetical protein